MHTLRLSSTSYAANQSAMVALNKHRPTRGLVIGGVVATACAAIAIWQSYHWCVSLTFCDATVCTDEGAVSLQVPLVRLAVNQKFETKATVYHRAQNRWEASNGRMKSTLDNWMAQSNEKWFHGWSLADFGYWHGDWQNEGRPGPFVVVFLPIWFAFGVAFLALAVGRRNWSRWSIRSMLILISVVGVCLWLLTLREKSAG